MPAWWWLGPRKRWLRGHIWLGLLSLVFVLCHSGFHIGGPLERLLWVIYGLTLATGLFGLALQQFMPRTLTTGLTSEAPYEQLPHISEVLRRKADVLASRVMANESASMQVSMFASQVGVGAKLQFQKFYEAHVRPFLRDGRAAGGPLATALAAEQAFERLSALPGLAGSAKELTELEALCAERRALAEQERLHRWLHGWLLIHVPLSVVLLVLGVTHIIAALYY